MKSNRDPGARPGQAQPEPTGRCAAMRDQLDEARRLLCLANRQGMRIPDTVLGPVLEADRNCAAHGEIGLHLENRFWKAYGDLRRTIEPADKARRLYRFVFYGALILMLLVQGSYLIGSRAHDHFVQLQEKALELQDKTGQLTQQHAALAGAEGGAEGAGAELLRQIAANREQINANQELQDGYRNLVKAVLFYLPAAPVIAVAIFKTILDFVAAYLLPALYGLLGACAFVLRQLSEDISNLRFAHDSRVRYNLRLNIGLLAGLAVGWFIDPTQEGSVVANLSPLALAFVAGYGSDLVFAVMDRIVHTFSGETDHEPATVPGQQPDRQLAEGAEAAAPATTTAAPEAAATRKRSQPPAGNGTAPVNGAGRRPVPSPAD